MNAAIRHGRGAVLRVELTEEVSQAIQEAAPDAAFALLNVAADYYERTHEPIPLDEALAKVKEISVGIEKLG